MRLFALAAAVAAVAASASSNNNQQHSSSNSNNNQQQQNVTNQLPSLNINRTYVVVNIHSHDSCADGRLGEGSVVIPANSCIPFPGSNGSWWYRADCHQTNGGDISVFTDRNCNQTVLSQPFCDRQCVRLPSLYVVPWLPSYFSNSTYPWISHVDVIFQWQNQQWAQQQQQQGLRGSTSSSQHWWNPSWSNQQNNNNQQQQSNNNNQQQQQLIRSISLQCVRARQQQNQNQNQNQNQQHGGY
jgi:hypothetical protein